MRIIGAADEFWRLRLVRVDADDSFDLEWHEDILYREPKVEPVGQVELYNVEAVRTDDYDAIVRVAEFGSRDEARAFYQQACTDLIEMTKDQFEDAYLAPGRSPRSEPVVPGDEA